MLIENALYLVLACRVKASMILGREVWHYQNRKAATRCAFSVIPIKYLQKFFLKITRENMGIKQIWFLRMQSM
jgi:hypothetical protein